MSITAKELAYAATTQVFTRNFRHLLPVPRFLVRGPFMPGQPKPKDTKPTDRIKYWNIVPGDFVRLRGDTKSVVHEVFRVNKLSNRVILKREINRAVSSKLLLFEPCPYERRTGHVGLRAAGQFTDGLLCAVFPVPAPCWEVRVPSRGRINRPEGTKVRVYCPRASTYK